MLQIIAYEQVRFGRDAANHVYHVAFVTKNGKLSKATFQNVYCASDMMRMSNAQNVENIDAFIEEHNATIEEKD